MLHGWIQLQPKDSLVTAQITYHYVNADTAKERLLFYLDKHLQVTELRCSKLKAYTVSKDTSSPMADFMNTVSIQLKEPVAKNETVEVAFSYQGSVPLHQFGDTPLPRNWIEIGANSISLTPIPVSFKPAAYDLVIQTDSIFSVFSPGIVTAREKGITQIASAAATLGVYFIMGRDLQVETFTFKGNTITLISDKASDSLKREVADMVAFCLEYYNSTFGQKNPKHTVTLALRPVKDLDASYAGGENYFVTYDSKDNFFHQKPFHFGNISHEIGHFWWHHADFTSTHNWLNEGFSEYVSLMARCVYLGHQEFEKQIQSLEKKVAQLPATLSLSNYDARGRFGVAMSYSKGALVLHQLERRVGQTDFIKLLADTALVKPKTGEEFVEIVARMLGSAQAQQVKEDMKMK